MHNARALGAFLAVVLSSSGAAAQYRNNGLFVEVGAESHEVLPFTLAMAGGTELGLLAWKQAHLERRVSRGPGARQGCAARVMSGAGGLPCRYDWWGLSDGPYLGVGFQRVVGDLLVDVSESPVLRNIVVTGRAGLSPALALPFGEDVIRPAALAHGEAGVRWNMADEKWRPFIGLAGTVTMGLDPVETFLQARRMEDTCRRKDAGEPLRTDEVCVRDQVQLPTGTSVNPSYVAFGMNAAPVMVGARPEAGVEWFFTEDVSVQASASAAVHVTVLPRYLLHAPFLGVDARGTVSAVAYF